MTKVTIFGIYYLLGAEFSDPITSEVQVFSRRVIATLIGIIPIMMLWNGRFYLSAFQPVVVTGDADKGIIL